MIRLGLAKPRTSLQQGGQSCLTETKLIKLSRLTKRRERCLSRCKAAACVLYSWPEFSELVNKHAGNKRKDRLHECVFSFSLLLLVLKLRLRMLESELKTLFDYPAC